MAEDPEARKQPGDNSALEDSVKVTPPVDPHEVEPEADAPVGGMALCLSGGGYRAMLFHLGMLWRLNELGYLPKLDRVSSVSGGSITAAVLALNWGHLDFDACGVARHFQTLVVEPVRRLGRTTIDIPAVLLGVIGPGGVGDRVAGSYRRHLFGGATLQDLPDRPFFVLNATNMQSGVLWRFTKTFTWDYRVGQIKNPRIELAVAVAASAAFPPVLSPVTLKLDDAAYTPQTGEDLQRPPYTTRVVLTDGGVYDNLGLETAWKRCRTILVSDAGGNLKPEGKPKGDWLRHTIRNLFIIDNQVRSLRKRMILDAYGAGKRLGAYWGIRTDIRNYRLPRYPLDCTFKQTIRLADIATRLKGLSPVTQQRLINWGYAVCDAAMRAHVDPALPEPAAFPYPDAGVG
jgi:NTE family protein